MRTLILILLLVFPVVAQTAATSTPYDAKTSEARAAFQDGKFDQALRLTGEALELARAAFGPNSWQAATSLTNLGVLYRSKGKYAEAVQNFDASIKIFEMAGKPRAREVIAAREALAVTHQLAGHNDEAVREFTKVIDIAEKTFGVDSIEMYSPTLSLARHYASSGNLDRGDDYFIKAYRIAYLRKGFKAEELNEVEDIRTCIVSPRDSARVASDSFTNALKAVREDIGGPPNDKPLVDPDVTVPGGVVNGKAISLPKPSYPASMSSGRKIGTVVVRVKIAEDGTVMEARATCGHPDFANNSVKAAFKSKFSPTLLSGQPVKVSGVIVYNFVGP